ncbi:hypothetical protein [Paenibacillus periandrae]|uniref:hypothetical protein n=1 Tax=Paenibacillus periandrae TaxID=1761741 RepID=UPI001F08E780|nr:hypothetical protein [Paenibacillus periandrae]
MDTWVWYPNMAEDYSDLETIRAELAEREEIFSKLPHIHSILIPGGDPGDVEADLLFQWSGQVAEILLQYHPQARIWLAPQIMKSELAYDWLETFYTKVSEEPEWLGGIAFAPWERTPLPELRARIPDKYPIRRYEDICHNFQCQYPVRQWDIAFAMTYGRESINPRPIAFKHIGRMGDQWVSRRRLAVCA